MERLLIYIATLFVRNILKDIEWDDIAESGPAVLAMHLAMPFTYSISAMELRLAFISYAANQNLAQEKLDGLTPAIWVIAVLASANKFIWVFLKI